MKQAEAEAFYSGNVYTFSIGFSDGSNFTDDMSVIAASYDSEGKCLEVRQCVSSDSPDIMTAAFDCTASTATDFGIYIVDKESLAPLSDMIQFAKKDIPESEGVKTKAYDAAYLLCYNTSFDAYKEGLNSGWLYDGRGAGKRLSITDSYSVLVDSSAEYSSSLIREFNLMNSGVIKLETSIKLAADKNGVYVDYVDKDGNLTYRLETAGGYFCVRQKDGTSRRLCSVSTNTSYKLRVTVDLDEGISETVINSVSYNSDSLLSDNVLSFRFLTGIEEESIITPSSVKMYVNYPVNDEFIFDTAGTVPYGYEGSATVKSSELVFASGSSAKRSFSAINGSVCFETLFIIPSGDDAVISLDTGLDRIVKFTAKDGYFSVDGKNIYDYTDNMWYRLRIESNTLTKKIIYRLNGRQIAEGTLPSDCTYFDAYSITLGTGSMRMDTFKVSVLHDRADYVPEPVTPAGYDDYYVGINVCSLWQNGVHFGWSCVTPFDEIQPVLGYYDEGNPESADWEIKFMVEHGINFQAFCWYSDQSSSPLKKPSNMQQLHDGYMYAKYSDRMKYCILWEAMNASHFNAENFRKYVIPYWIENYFLDDRYMTIDNKLVLCVFGSSYLDDADYFGSVAGVKTEFDYLRSVVKGLGFDDIIILSCGSSSSTAAGMGFDGSYAYNWGTSGCTIDTNKAQILNSAKVTSMQTVPTISTGFNNIAWAQTRHPNMTVEDYLTSHEWVRDTYLPTYGKGDGGWTDKLVMVSTWNEYGEGTYVMPSGLNGFGYLDVLRKVYTSAPDEHTDTVPDTVQKERITHLYPQYARLLRKLGNYIRPVPEKSLKMLALNSSTAYIYNGMNTTGLSSTSEYIYGKGSNNDPIVQTKISPSVDASLSKILVVTAKTPANTLFEVFFTTDTSTAYSQDKSIGCVSKSSDWEELVFDFSDNAAWKGTITGIRLDPVPSSGTTFYLKSIDFRDTSTNVSSALYIDDYKIENSIYSESDSTGTYHPFDPALAVQYMLRSFMYWDNASQTLSLDANRHKVVYTVGSDTALVDGTARQLGKAVYTVDGLPMISFTQLADFLGYDSRVVDSDVYIYTPYYVSPDSLPHDETWEFNTAGNAEGWGSGSVTSTVQNGALHISSSVNDPYLFSADNLGIDASSYKTVRVRMKHTYTGKADMYMGFYFTTTADTAWNQQKYVSAKLDTASTGDDYVVYNIDLTSNENWTGTIKQLRLDPFNSAGTADVDYIRLINKTFSLINGDAEDTSDTSYYSNNAVISIVQDSSDPTNHVINVKSNANANNYTYLRTNVRWTPGTTYSVDYDMKLISAYDGSAISAAQIIANAVYADSVKGSNDHILISQSITPSNGWIHVSTQFNVSEFSTTRSNDQFSIYANPVNGRGVIYQIDNIVVKPIA